MKNADSSRWLLRIVVGLGIIGLSTIGGSADLSKKPMHETATVPSDSNIRKRFKVVDDYLADERWTEAIDVLQEISQAEGRTLVRHEESPNTVRYVNVTTRCNLLLSGIPAEGLAAYRKKVDPQARRWFEAWIQTRDTAELQRIVRHAYLSSVGDDALWALGEVAWDQGDFASARLYWTQLLPIGKDVGSDKLPTTLRYPDSDLNVEEVQSRLVLCTLMEGEPDRAAIEQIRFAEKFPLAEGTLAGRRGLLAQVLKQILDDASGWDVRSGVREVATYGVTPSRCGTFSSTVEIGAARWSRKLTPSVLPHLVRGGAVTDPGPPSFHPVVHQDIVFVNDAERIYAWNIVSGEPAWPTDSGSAEIYAPEAQMPTNVPDHFSSGVPNYTMTLADGRLYARMGSAITNRANNENEFPSDLVCLDIAAAQGKLVWKINSSDLLKDGSHPWRFEGSPLVIYGRVYVALSWRRPQLEFCIACLDAATGTLLWNRPIVTARGVVEEHQNRISHLLLTYGAGKLFFSTDAGAIVALSTSDGRLEWAVTYESLPPQDMALLSDHNRQGLVPAMFHEGWLFVAPNDCNQLLCIEADSGQVFRQWNHPERERWRHLLGVVDGGTAGRLIVSGNSLYCLDIASVKTKVVYGPKSSPRPADMRGYGRGVMAGNLIYWPTRDTIKVIDAATGKTITNKPLNNPQSAETGGNIILAQEMLLVAQHDRLVAYCEYSLLKQRLERELSNRSDQGPSSQSPVSASPSRPIHMTTEEILGQLADIEAATGNLDSAAEALRKGLQLGQQRMRSRFRLRLLEILRQSAREVLERGEAKEAWDRLTEARTLTVDPKEIAGLLIEMGYVELRRGNPLAAIDLWQEVLDAPRLRDSPDRQSTFGATATAAISKLLTDEGRGNYSSVERRASEVVAARIAANDPDGLRQALLQFPNSVVADQAWKPLARLERQRGRLHAAIAIYARLINQETDANEQASILAEWADVLEAGGYWRPAHGLWTELTSEDLMNETVALNGKSLRAETLAHERLSNAGYRFLQPNEETSPTYLERIWSVPLDADQPTVDVPATQHAATRLIVPDGDPPSDQLCCLLIRTGNSQADPSAMEWSCMDRGTGHVRWKRKMELPPRWAGYGKAHLLMATQTRLFAVTLESGEELWNVALPSDSNADRRGTVDATSPAGLAPRSKKEMAPIVELALRDQWVFAFSPRSGLTAIDTQSGQTDWSFMPPRGIVQKAWKCGSRKIALQTLRPSVIWQVEISAERQVTELRGGEPWLQGPVNVDDKLMVQVTQDHRIEAFSKTNPVHFWKYSGGMSVANGPPVLWSAAGQLLMTVDGTTLTGIDRRTGKADWTAGLADLPLDNPETQTIAVGDAVFAASQGLLRRISLRYRSSQWERYLGATTDQWRVAACGSTIAAWPVQSRSRSANDLVASVPQFVVWSDAETGRLLQRFNMADGEKLVNVVGGSSDCIVETDRNVIAFRASSEPDNR